MKAPIKILLALIIFISQSSCGSTSRTVEVVHISDNARTIGKVVMLNENAFNHQLRKSLASVGFNVPPYASTKEITIKSKNLEQKFNEAATRLGIKHSGLLSIYNPCFTNRAAANFKEYQLEIVDLKYNETVLILRNSGWTENCPGDFLTVGQTTDLFGDLARSLAENFNEIKLSN